MEMDLFGSCNNVTNLSSTMTSWVLRVTGAIVQVSGTVVLLEENALGLNQSGKVW